jgi:Swt1-like HEPN
LPAVLGDKWPEAAREGITERRGTRAPTWGDPQTLLGVMTNRWNDVFGRTLSHAGRSLVHELRDVHNRWAHREAFPSNDAYRALDSVERLLCAVSAPQAVDVGQMRMDLLRAQFEEQRRSEMRKTSFQPAEDNHDSQTRAESIGSAAPPARVLFRPTAHRAALAPLPARRSALRPRQAVPRAGQVLAVRCSRVEASG